MEKKQYEVICINVPQGGSFEQITAIGYQDHDGKAYIIPVEEAVRMMEQQEADFFVQAGSREIPLFIETAGGKKCVNIALDNHQRNMLLKLRECKPAK